MKVVIKMGLKDWHDLKTRMHEFVLNENEYVWKDLFDGSKMYLTKCTCHNREAYVSFQFQHAEWKEDIDKILENSKRKREKHMKKIIGG